MPKKYTNVMETRFTADDRFSRAVGRMSKGMQRMNRIAGRLKRGLMAAGGAMIALGRGAARAAKVGLVAFSGAALAVFLSVNKLADGMDSLAKTTRAIDFPIEDFQEFRFAAEQTGVDGAKFGSIVKKFSATVGEFKGGYGTLFTALKKVNPELAKQLKNTSNTSEAFELYLGAIRDTPDAIGKAALSSAAFGKRMGIDMINMANLSADELGKLREQMRKNGVVTAEQAAKAEAYNDSMNRLKLTIKGVAITALTPLMPMLEKGADRIRDWTIRNRALINQKVELYFERVKKYAKIAFFFLRESVPPLIKRLRQIGSDGFAWIKENKSELKSFFELIKWAGGVLLKTATFVIKHKYAVLGLVVAYKALSASMRLMEWSAMTSGAASAGGAMVGLGGKIKIVAGMLGKGGVLAVAAAGGWAVGSVIVDKWINGMDKIALSAENAASKLSMGLGKASESELDTRLATLKKQEKELGSKFSMRSVKAILSGDIGDVTSARAANRDAQAKVLQEKFDRLVSGNNLVGQRNAMGYMAGRQSGGVGDAPALNPVDAMPQAQVSRSENVTVERVELTINDKTGSAEVSRTSTPTGLTLIRTGAM